jgi:hypothetical protein
VSDGPERARREWAELRIDEALAGLHPALVSSLASGLHAEHSDLDVVCDTRGGDLVAMARRAYGDRPGFETWTSGERTLVAFDGPTLRVEISGEARPVEEQTAYRHALVHRRLAELGGPGFAAHVRDLRARHGLKTEPALAAALGLPGDPYAAIEALADAPDDRLLELLIRAPGGGGSPPPS